MRIRGERLITKAFGGWKSMFLDELCSIGKTFEEDEKYILSRYEHKDQELYSLVTVYQFIL